MLYLLGTYFLFSIDLVLSHLLLTVSPCLCSKMGIANVFRYVMAMSCMPVAFRIRTCNLHMLLWPYSKPVARCGRFTAFLWRSMWPPARGVYMPPSVYSSLPPRSVCR